MGYKLAIFGTVAVLVQVISSQCIGNLNKGPRPFANGVPYGPNQIGPKGPGFGPNIGPNPFGQGGIGQIAPGPAFGPNAFGPGGTGAASTGGSFAVTSASPVSPTGVSVLAENLAIEGGLTVGGNLPFLGTVGIEGLMPGAGAGSVSYGCGNGNIGIENLGAYGSSAGFGTGPYGANAVNPATAYAGPNPAGPYGLPGSINRPTGFGSGVGFNGFNNIGLNGFRK